MNKEIEILERAENMTIEDNVFHNEHKGKWLSVEDFNILKQFLTPPTADEVCKALSEYWGNPFRYNKNTNLFEHYVGDIMWKRFNILILRTDAPDLIEMIGKFYKGEKDE